MINLIPLGSNICAVKIKNSRGEIEILFSYETPVACRVIFKSGTMETVCTDRFYSTTTSKHINIWLAKWGLDKNRVFHSECDVNNHIKYFTEGF
jgi:hypothetical protein